MDLSYSKKLHNEFLKMVLSVRDECASIVRHEEEAIDMTLNGLYLTVFPGPKLARNDGTKPNVFGGCGHILIDDVTGTGKTFLAKVFGSAMGLDNSRIQLTPDIRPSDIVGTDFIEMSEDGKKEFVAKPGPVLTNILLVDEINRGTPKTLSALIEVAGEGQFATVGTREKMFYLLPPFFLMATENPIEQEGVYHLPEAITDRIAFKIPMNDPNQKELMEVSKTVDSLDEITVKQYLNREGVEKIRKFIHKNIMVDDKVLRYITEIITSHRYKSPGSKYLIALEKQLGITRLLNERQQYRRAIFFLRAAGKVEAFMNSRNYVTFSDIDKLALSVLRVRTILTGEAQTAINEDKIDILGWTSGRGGRNPTIEVISRDYIYTTDQLIDQLTLRTIKGTREL